MPSPDRHLVAAALHELSRYAELSDRNKFKAIAFRNAARAIETSDRDLSELARRGELKSIPGIGTSTASMVEELVRTGALRYLDELRGQYPAGILELMEVPGLSVRKIGELHEKLGISTVEELEEACRANRLLALPGFGAKTQEKLLEGIGFARAHTGQFLLPWALGVAEDLVEAMLDLPGIAAVEIAGEVRRRLEVVSGISLVVSSTHPEKALAEIRKRELLAGFELSSSRAGRGTARDAIEVLVSASHPLAFGTLLAIQTGSPEFVEGLRSIATAKKLRLSDDTLLRGKTALSTPAEKELFEHLGAHPVPPELREDASYLGRKRPPRLVSVENLKGTFHAHSTWSDGKATLDQMIDASAARGWQYIGMSDHSKTASYAGGLIEAQVALQTREIARIQKRVAPMRIFHGTEADILADGKIDYHDTILDQFEFVIASVHSRFKMARDEMTERILKALSDPRVTFLGHLTGRLLLSRAGYSVDFDRIFDAAARYGVIIEINGNPNRLDLDWRHMQRALDRGVLFSINPDAHYTENLGHVVSGTWAARKGGLSARHIFNTRSLDEVTEYLQQRRGRN